MVLRVYKAGDGVCRMGALTDHAATGKGREALGFAITARPVGVTSATEQSARRESLLIKVLSLYKNPI